MEVQAHRAGQTAAAGFGISQRHLSADIFRGRDGDRLDRFPLLGREGKFRGPNVGWGVKGCGIFGRALWRWAEWLRGFREIGKLREEIAGHKAHEQFHHADFAVLHQKRGRSCGRREQGNDQTHGGGNSPKNGSDSHPAPRSQRRARQIRLWRFAGPLRRLGEQAFFRFRCGRPRHCSQNFRRRRAGLRQFCGELFEFLVEFSKVECLCGLVEKTALNNGQRFALGSFDQKANQSLGGLAVEGRGLCFKSQPASFASCGEPNTAQQPWGDESASREGFIFNRERLKDRPRHRFGCFRIFWN